MAFTEKWKVLRTGLLFSVLAGLFYAAGNVILIPYVPKIGTLYVVCFRFLIQTASSIPPFLAKPEILTTASKKEWLIAFISGICIGVAALAAYPAFTIIPIMDATTIFNTNPVLVTIISAVWLKEKIGKLEMSLMIVILVGVMCICQPTFIFGSLSASITLGLEDAWKGYLLSLSVSVAAALASCCTRRIQTTSATIIIFAQGLIVAIPTYIIGTITMGDYSKMSSVDWLIVVAGASLTTTARNLITKALQWEKAPMVTTLSTTEIFFSMIFQITVFKLYPNWIGILGAVFVASGVVMMSFKDNIIDFYKKWKSGSVLDMERSPLIRD